MSALSFTCRGCGHQQIPVNQLARSRLEKRGLCQGCRAADTLRDRPWLLKQFTSFWLRTGFPESNAWLEALPAATDANADAVGAAPELGQGIAPL